MLTKQSWSNIVDLNETDLNEKIYRFIPSLFEFHGLVRDTSAMNVEFGKDDCFHHFYGEMKKVRTIKLVNMKHTIHLNYAKFDHLILENCQFLDFVDCTIRKLTILSSEITIWGPQIDQILVYNSTCQLECDVKEVYIESSHVEIYKGKNVLAKDSFLVGRKIDNLKMKNSGIGGSFDYIGKVQIYGKIDKLSRRRLKFI